MAAFNIKKLSERLKDAAESATSAVKDGVIQETIGNVATAVKEGAVQEAISNAASTVLNADIPDIVTRHFERADVGKPSIEDPDATQWNIAANGLASSDALCAFYYLMSSDGAMHDNELERFDSICHELGADTEKAALEQECQDSMSADSAISCISRILDAPKSPQINEQIVPPKLLVWDLLVLAYADGACGDDERELIDLVALKAEVSEDVVAEMEQSLLAMNDVESEARFIRESEPFYIRDQESVIASLEARRDAIFEGVKALITF